MGGYVIVSEIGSQITFIRDNLPIKKSDLLLKKPIPIFYMIVIWLEKAWLVNKYVQNISFTWCDQLQSFNLKIDHWATNTGRSLISHKLNIHGVVETGVQAEEPCKFTMAQKRRMAKYKKAVEARIMEHRQGWETISSCSLIEYRLILTVE